MNNDQFRKLAFSTGTSSGDQNAASSSASPAGGVSRALGSRQKASIPMTPRYGSDVSRMAFARQLADRNNDTDGDKKKKFRTSKPKGSKFAAGYVDRAKMRSDKDEDDDRAARLAALEELYKDDGVDQATYEKLRFKIAGGDLSSTHLVKGLDFKLLGRVRMGEDVFGEAKTEGDQEAENDTADPAAADAPPTAAGGDVDDEFERLEESEVQAIEREKEKKKGQYSTTAAATTLVPGQKRSRDQILAEMKAAREAAKQAKAAAAKPALGSRFKKIGATQAAGSRIERDSHGQEVLVIVDEDGHERRKVRKVAMPVEGRPDAKTDAQGHEAPRQEGKVLGMEVPEFYRKKQEAEAAAAAAKVVDIFEDAGSDYDPLAGMGSDSSDSESDEDKKDEKDKDKKVSRDADKQRRRSLSSSDREDGEASDSSRGSDHRRRQRRSPPRRSRDERRPPAARPTEPATVAPRKDYFGGSTLLSEESSRGGPSLDDPSVLAALRKAKQMREATESEEKSKEQSKEAEREERLKKLLQNSDRDAEDLDMGFGTNRMEDRDDMDEEGGGEHIRLSTWRGGKDGGGDDDGDEKGGSRGDKTKRKRGAKKRKGDGNNAEDVMRVLEKRRETRGS